MKWIYAVIAIFLTGCILMPDITREGFTEKDLIAPHPWHGYLDTKPYGKNSFIHYGRYDIKWSIGKLYPGYNGVVKIDIANIGSTDIFIYNIDMKVDGKSNMWLDDNNHGLYVNRGETKTFYVSFKCPSAGKHNYSIGVYYMARKFLWYDCGSYYTGTYILNISHYGNKINYRYIKNYYVYFDKINKLVNTIDPTVMNKEAIATAGYGSDYNIAKVCAIFNYVLNNMQYKNDTDGDIWNSPSTALLEGGDCEEFAMTMAAMTEAAGGTARVYLTDNHAFAAIYIGKDLNLLNSIDSFYHANLSYALFNDSLGYWIVADPLSSSYLGGLPVGGFAYGKDGKTYKWSISTNELYSIDVMKD